jgi:hypothetical protein
MEKNQNMASTEKTQDEWRQALIDYYTTNAPTKVSVVTDSFMTKWAGKYDKLFEGMQKKYGLPGQPIVPPPAKTKPTMRRGPPGGGGGGRSRGGPKPTIAASHDVFTQMIHEAQSAAADSAETTARSRRPAQSLMSEAKQAAAANGLETSAFTVCARIRPVLEQEKGRGGDEFACVFPDPAAATSTSALHMENAMILSPEHELSRQSELEKNRFYIRLRFQRRIRTRDFRHCGETFGRGRTGRRHWRHFCIRTDRQWKDTHNE